jgi:hypothetical protein
MLPSQDVAPASSEVREPSDRVAAGLSPRTAPAKPELLLLLCFHDINALRYFVGGKAKDMCPSCDRPST